MGFLPYTRGPHLEALTLMSHLGLQRPAGVTKGEAADSWRSRNGPGRVVVIANSYRSAPPRSLEPPSRRRSPKDAADVAFRPTDANSVALDEVANESIGESEAAAWTAALLPLVKGKITVDEAKMAQSSDVLGEVERADLRGRIAREVLTVSIWSNKTWASARVPH
jgi:hypothetical protein